MSSASDPVESLRQGISSSDQGARGIVFEPTAHFGKSIERHERVLAYLDSNPDGPSGGLLLLRLSCEEAVLSKGAFNVALSKYSELYCCDGQRTLAWKNAQGWQERRHLSDATAELFLRNGSATITHRDRKWAVRVLANINPEISGPIQWRQHIHDASAWWFARMPSPLLAHAMGLKPFPLLDSYAVARGVSGLPQLSAGMADTRSDQMVARIRGGRRSTEQFQTIVQLIHSVGRVSRAKMSKAQGRQKILEEIKLLTPLALAEGKSQILVLAGFEYVVVNGGIRGYVLSPTSLHEYIQSGLLPLLKLMVENEPEGMPSDWWKETYQTVLNGLRESQRSKFAAFLEAFHRFLIIVGCQPLPGSLQYGGTSYPPASAVIHPAELERALSYVEVSSTSTRVKLQVRIALKLGNAVELRSYDLWCLRIGDIHPGDYFYIDINARVRDGIGKTLSARRQRDISDFGLRADLLDLLKLRKDDDAIREDVLFGQPGVPDGRHCEVETNALINDSLRWATGNDRASFYDLRHTSFSRQWDAAYAAALEGGEGFDLARVSAEGSHAGQESSYPYINAIEVRMRDVQKAARPASWCGIPKTANEASCFPDVAVGRVQHSTPPLPDVIPAAPVLTSVELSISRRAGMLRKVAAGIKLQAIANSNDVSLEVLKEVIVQFAKAVVLAGLVPLQSVRDLQGQCLVLTHFYTWARAAKQAKHAPLMGKLDQLQESEDWGRLSLAWLDWSACLHKPDFSLEKVLQGQRFIQLLLEAGTPKSSILITYAPAHPPIPLEFKTLAVTVKKDRLRAGRAKSRLFVVEPGASLADAKFAAISMLGFHWVLLALGSALVTKGEI